MLVSAIRVALRQLPGIRVTEVTDDVRLVFQKWMLGGGSQRPDVSAAKTALFRFPLNPTGHWSLRTEGTGHVGSRGRHRIRQLREDR